jgi:hypothetical protein
VGAARACRAEPASIRATTTSTATTAAGERDERGALLAAESPGRKGHAEEHIEQLEPKSWLTRAGAGASASATGYRATRLAQMSEKEAI